MGRVRGRQESIRRDNILDYELGRDASSNSASSSIQRITLACAEAVPVNAGVCISDTGFALLATIQWVDNRELHGISKTAGAMNENIELYNDGEIVTIEDANFVPGKIIRLDANKKFTTDYTRVVGNFNHSLGTAISKTSFRIRIEEPLRIM